MATELAKAYIQIIPTAEGIKGKLSEALGGEAESAGKAAGEKAGNSAGSSFGSVLAGAAKAGLAAISAAAAGVVTLTKSAIENYAEYEQLVGGVETLFKDAAGTVQEYAANAYKTAGLSANDYMSTVTSFSASLLQSLDGDTEEAAKIADMAISDMSDNANKMGSDMSSIQNAYMGFAKQNYTMLDNLKLGYGGTKSEMERLLADATALTGIEYDINSLKDVYEAIHVIQTELDITGTTAKEASTTIQGSLSMMKSSWTNLVTGIADENADFEALVGNFVESVSTVASNIMPRIQQALSGVGQLVEGLAPVIASAIPTLVTEVLPPLMEAAATLLMTLTDSIVENMPTLLETAGQIVMTLVQGIADNIDYLLQAGLDMMLEIGRGLAEGDGIQTIIDAALEIIDSLATWLGEYSSVLAETAIEVIKTLADALMDANTLSSLMESALMLIEYLAEAIVKNIPELLDTAIEIIDNLVDFLIDNVGELIDAAVEIILTLAEGVIENLPKLIEKAPEIIQKLVDAIIENVPKLIDAAIEIIVKLTEGIIQNLPQLLESATQIVFTIAEGIVRMLNELVLKGKEIVDKVKEGFDQKVADAKNWGHDLIQGFVNGLKEKWENLKQEAVNLVNSVKTIFTRREGLDTHSPSKWAEGVFANVMEGATEGLQAGLPDLLSATRGAVGDIKGAFAWDSPAFAMAGGPAYNAGAGAGSAAASELRGIVDALRGMRVVLSTGETVGALTVPLNDSLGNQYSYSKRGI